MKEAFKLISKSLNQSSAEFFEGQLDDFNCYIRSFALVDFKSSIEDVKVKFTEIVNKLIENTVRFFLMEKYGINDEGMLKVVVKDGKIYDEEGLLIPEVNKLIKNKPRILEVMLDFAVQEFEKGRVLATEISTRAKIKKTSTSRDYISWPAFEFIEIEILRLEKKLPMLSPEEGRRLCSLYERQHNQASLEQELSYQDGGRV